MFRSHIFRGGIFHFFCFVLRILYDLSLFSAPYGTNDNVAHAMRTKEEFEKILTEIRDAHESLKYNNSLPILGD